MAWRACLSNVRNAEAEIYLGRLEPHVASGFKFCDRVGEGRDSRVRLYEIRILAALSADLKVGAAAWELRNMSWKRIISIVRLLCTTLAIISLESAAAFARTNYAVVVAATSYPNLPPKSSLVGPNNDAALIRDYLTKNSPVPFAPENITLLADDMEGGSTPTHAAIQQTFAKLARKVVEGDFVYLHFSGHGSQQPEMKVGNETDGLDEIFLPADTGQWKNRAAGVPNALVDDEIGASLDAIRNAGAFVWFVIDACNSGTATSAACRRRHRDRAEARPCRPRHTCIRDDYRRRRDGSWYGQSTGKRH